MEDKTSPSETEECRITKEPKKLEDLSVLELKAVAFDTGEEIKQRQELLNVIKQIIRNKQMENK